MNLKVNMNFSLLIVFLIAIVVCLGCNFEKAHSSIHRYQEGIDKDDSNYKHKGAHIFGRVDSVNLKPFIKQNIEWVTYVPYAGQADYNSDGLNFNRGGRERSERRDSMWRRKIDISHSLGLKVMLKPHVWLYEVEDGKWRSDIYPDSDEGWGKWKEDYRRFILKYAELAQETNVELFCVGTELTRLSTEKNDFWRQLISEIRTVYKGELIYAANWYAEYENITFWDQLDYIGVQAYFPLTKKENPSVDEISKGWNKYLPELKKVSDKYNKKILFTEMGYKSTADSGIEPWTWVEGASEGSLKFSEETQVNCYKSFFENVWPQKWFAGVHIWQLRCDVDYTQYDSNINFTTQGKLADQVVKLGFE